MPNYKSREDDLGGSLVGGAMDLLNQYEANVSGDQYSEKNPSDEYKKQMENTVLTGGDLDSLKGVKNAKNHLEAVKAVHKLTPMAHHMLVRTAGAVKHFHKGSMSKTHPGDMDFTTKKGDKDFHEKGHDIVRSRTPFHMGVITDIQQSKSPHHLASMIHKDKDMGGGGFLDDLGKVAGIVAPFAPLLI